MYNQQKHKLILIDILKAISSNGFLSSTLGFKGGTAMQLFYGLPRYSVDLDFDLLDGSKEKKVLEVMGKLLLKHGKVTDQRIKRYNIFFLVDYGLNEKKIKVEINRRVFKRNYELQNFLGISMLIMDKPSMASNKLLAMLTRRIPASRDLFDAWFILHNNWNIDEEIIFEITQENLKDFLEKAVKFVENYPESSLLQSLGELLDAKQKAWVKNNLKKELVFEIEKHLEVMK